MIYNSYKTRIFDVSMISIIICSRNKNLLNTVSESVKNTIGVPYEIIAVENSDGKYGICKAYNIGAAKAQYDIFCFMHEDITFETQNWGQNVVNHLKDENVGLIGVAGINLKGIIPTILNKGIADVSINIIQIKLENNKDVHLFNKSQIDENLKIKEVAMVDGVLMCTRRSVYDLFHFDDVILDGFHAYDVDLSLQIQTKFKLCVVYDLLVNHLSATIVDKRYYEQSLRIYHKWKKILPVSVIKLSKEDLAEYHWLCMDYFFKSITNYDYKLPFILKYFFFFSFNKYFKYKPFFSLIIKILGKRYFKLKFSYLTLFN